MFALAGRMSIPAWFASLGLTLLNGSPIADTTLAGKAVLFVNVASRCGYTPQYKALESLYQTYKDKGLVVVGVPCNQFGSQEPGTAEEIASFCSLNYGVTFPLLQKQDVNGANRSALYTWLVKDGQDVKWNFEKFLVTTDGVVKQRYKSSVTPDDATLAADIAAALPK
jgi:glutathione peroxidase-family protein